MITRALVLLLVFGAAVAAPPAAEEPRKDPPTKDPELARQLDAIDARAAKIKDFTARFRQEKFTALLKKPLVSTGRVRVATAAVRWDTEKPEPAVLFSDGKDVRMYYPGQRLLEVYPIDQRLGDLAASPLPKLETLREHFSIERAPPDTFKNAGAKRDDPPTADTNAREAKDTAAKPARKSLALRMIPLEDAIRDHVEEVNVLLDIEAAHILELEVIDADGDRTHITFDDVRLDTGIKPADLALTVPQGTAVSRPLDAQASPPKGRD